MKKILVNEGERRRILNLHTEATKKEFLIEQTEELIAELISSLDREGSLLRNG